ARHGGSGLGRDPGPGGPVARGGPAAAPSREQTHCGSLEIIKSSGKRPVQIVRRDDHGLADPIPVVRSTTHTGTEAQRRRGGGRRDGPDLWAVMTLGPSAGSFCQGNGRKPTRTGPNAGFVFPGTTPGLFSHQPPTRRSADRTGEAEAEEGEEEGGA